jgi:hypothetical protein
MSWWRWACAPSRCDSRQDMYLITCSEYEFGKCLLLVTRLHQLPLQVAVLAYFF